MYRVRRMEMRDLHHVTALDRLVFPDPWPESSYIQELCFNPHAYYFVLELTQPQPHWRWPWKSRASDLLGFVGLRMENERAHISTLAVHPDWRGLGFGELLLVVALEQAARLEAHSVILEVRPSNQRARQLYAKYRFVPVGRLSHYYQDGEDALLLEVQPLDSGYCEQLPRRLEQLQQRIQERLQ